MKFTSSLIKGKLIKRYKRFFVDIEVNNKIITAHCPNTGSMMGLIDEGNRVWLTKHNDPKRKLKYTLEMIEVKKKLIGVNTHRANKIVEHALENKLINEFKNINIIPINIGGESYKKSKEFFDEIKIKNLDIFTGSGPEFSQIFKLRGLPTTILIDRNGFEVGRIVGYIDFNDQSLLDWLPKNL